MNILLSPWVSDPKQIWKTFMILVFSIFYVSLHVTSDIQVGGGAGSDKPGPQILEGR